MDASISPWDDTPDRATNPTPEAIGTDLRGQWAQFLNDPNGQAAMLQFGLSLMQPVAAGQSAFGHLGQAVGSVGGMVERNRKSDLEERKMELAETTADDKLELGRARIEVAGAKNEAQAARDAHRLTLQEASLALREKNLERLTLRDKVDLDRKERDLKRKLNNDELREFFQERGLELREDELGRRIDRDKQNFDLQQQRIDQRERDLGRKMSNDEKRLFLREQGLELRREQSGLTQNFRQSQAWERYIKTQADSAEKQRDNFMERDNKWKGKTRQQIEAELRRDPVVRDNFMRGYKQDSAPAPGSQPAPTPGTGTGTSSAPVPTPGGTPDLSPARTAIPLPVNPSANNLTPGQAYRSPSGKVGIWNGTGFDPVE